MRFLHSRDGATSIEFSLIASLVSIAIIIGALATGNAVASLFNLIGARMQAVAATIGA